MPYKTRKNASAERQRDDALDRLDRAWWRMHRTGLRIGRQSPEYQADREAVVIARAEVSKAAVEASLGVLVKTDALSDLVRDVGDDSSPTHKAIFHLWAALDDLAEGRPVVNHPQLHAARALEAAARVLGDRDSRESEAPEPTPTNGALEGK